MSLTVTLISGPRRAGKSLVADLIMSEVLEGQPHYLRLSASNGDRQRSLTVNPPRPDCPVKSSQWVGYANDRIYELLPEILAIIHHRDSYGHVIIEADADPVLRHAYPYDQQLFVMPPPRSLSDVFRSSVQAARALQDVLDDTAEFAAEVFGLPLCAEYLEDDTVGNGDLLSKSQIRGFLASPLGDHLATRLQLHPEYHGLVESDVVLINTGAGGAPAMADGCCERLERLLARVQSPAAGRGTIFCCDPTHPADPRRGEFLQSVRILYLQRT